MKEYTVDSPTYSATIKITETTDPAHADNINAAPKQLLENTVANHQDIENIKSAMFSASYDEDTETLYFTSGTFDSSGSSSSTEVATDEEVAEALDDTFGS